MREKLIKKQIHFQSDLSIQSTPTIIISGMGADFCRIVNINNSAAGLFGYQKPELLGKKVEILMPEVYAVNHDIFVSKYIETTKGNMINQERRILGRHKTQYLFPTNITIKPIEDTSLQTLHFFARFETPKQLRSQCYILTLENGKMLGISASCVELLGYGYSSMRKYKNVNRWFPGLIDEVEELKLDKKGKRFRLSVGKETQRYKMPGSFRSDIEFSSHSRQSK